MAVSLIASKPGLDKVDQARRKKGWTKYEKTWSDLAITSTATLKRFWAGKPIAQETFVAICQIVGIADWEAIADFNFPITPSDRPSLPFAFDDSTWVERSELTAPLLQVLRGQYRVVAFVGITGIGKTEFAGRLISELDDKRFCRLNLDEGSVTADFASSGAALLRALGEEPTLEDQKDAKNLLNHLLQLLRTQPCRVQVDSMEKLLEGNDQDGWSEFCDPLWLDLVQQVLAGNECQSQLILTTQDVPGALAEIGSRYEQLWHCEPIRGLSEAEQLQLFQKRGIVAAFDANATGQHQNVIPSNASAAGQLSNVSTHSVNAEADNANATGQYPDVTTSNAIAVGQHQIAEASNAAAADSPVSLLRRIGKLYAGHPLVLRVIAEDIKTCGGDVQRYWRLNKFAELEANRPAELSRSKLQLEVKRRVKAALNRLPKDALDLLCRAAVFRRPVPEAFWLAMLPDCSAPQAALNVLKARALAEEDWEPGAWLGADGAIPFRQHNLIRSIAYELLKVDKTTWETVERQAAELWLNRYEPAPDAPNLEKVRGYLEAFDHYLEVKDYQQAYKIPDTILATKKEIYWQLLIWGYFRELIPLHSKRLKIAQALSNRRGEGIALGCLGIAYNSLGNYGQAIDYHQQHLAIAREIDNRQGEGNALGNLGNTYYSLGSYGQAIDYHQQHLAIAREIGDRQGEGNALGNLGNTYYSLGSYRQAIDYHQQCLTIFRDTGDRQGEGNALGNLGNTYYNLGSYGQAIDYHQQCLTIFRDTGDRQGEGSALGGLGNAYDNLGSYGQAIDYYQQHLAIAHEIGDRRGEGIALGNWGYTLIKLEHYSNALERLQPSLEIFRNIGDRANEAEALLRLAETHQQLGEMELAREECDQALALATELGIPLVEECRKLKAELEKGGG